MLTDLYMCAPGTQRETREAMDDPTGVGTRQTHGLIETKGLEFVVLLQLADALGVAGEAVHPPDPDEDEQSEQWFMLLSDEFVAALGTATEPNLRRAGERWIEIWTADLASIPAYGGQVPDYMRPGLDDWWPVLVELARLATAARDRQWCVYLWVCLLPRRSGSGPSAGAPPSGGVDAGDCDDEGEPGVAHGQVRFVRRGLARGAVRAGLRFPRRGSRPWPATRCRARSTLGQ